MGTKYDPNTLKTWNTSELVARLSDIRLIADDLGVEIKDGPFDPTLRAIKRLHHFAEILFVGVDAIATELDERMPPRAAKAEPRDFVSIAHTWLRDFAGAYAAVPRTDETPASPNPEPATKGPVAPGPDDSITSAPDPIANADASTKEVK
jgi:hypothetical protein